MPAPSRGEVWLVDLGMVAKVRPCLVLSVPIGPQDRVLATLIGHTTSTRGSQFEVPVQVRFLEAGAFDAQSLVNGAARQVDSQAGGPTAGPNRRG